jgi:hypothetical protein
MWKYKTLKIEVPPEVLQKKYEVGLQLHLFHRAKFLKLRGV